MKLLLAILLPLLAGCLPAPAQILSTLLRTNAVADTNTLPVVMRPLVTNGTRQVTVANLFSNRTHYGAVTITNLNTEIVATAAFTNANALTNVVWSLATAADRAYYVEARVAGYLVATGESAFTHAVNSFYNFGGAVGARGQTNLYRISDQAAWAVLLDDDGSSTLRLRVAGNGVFYRASIRVLSTP